MNRQYSSIWPIDRTLSGVTTPSQTGPVSDGNEEVLRIPQSSSITGTSASDCLVLNPGHSLVEGVLSLCKDAVGVFYSPSRLGKWKRNILMNIYEVHTISFQTFFAWAFKIVVDFWNFSMLLLYIWPIFMISGSNQQPRQELECTLLKPDCHSRWISKMQSDTLEERYAIKFCFKLGKIPQQRMECFRLFLEHLAWVEHQFLSGIRVKEGRMWEIMRGVGGERKSIHQSWLAKGLR